MPLRDLAGAGIDRRSFIGLLAAANSAFLTSAKAAGKSYQVGVGYSSDPYTAASAALSSCGQFPTKLAGQTVVIKPNLVAPKPADSGATTDPRVVQAIVDLCLSAGATQILIVEAAPPGKPSNFTPCGYTSLFATYPEVQLVDLRTGTYVLTAVPSGKYAYQSMWIPSVVVQPQTYFISAAKLKTHVDAVVTLSMKNLVGLASETAYALPVDRNLPRHDLHLRGIDLSIMDLNLVRPVDFAVIDGVWGMQGEGPTNGTPVATNVVLAGLNHVAVDRVGLNVMEISQNAVTYLNYAAEAGLGPANTSNVTLLGDSYTPDKFTLPITPPVLIQPIASPGTISISAGQSTAITYKIKASCYTSAAIIQDSDSNPGIVPVRTLHESMLVPAPGETITWNGKNDAGEAVAPGTYLAQIQAAATPTSHLLNYAVGRVVVTA
ncbi:MAG TPA: DUF362 domain-containing protein [Bryobacteraceae bacterium]|jgi:uncharacterized protein (DUF362 family)|nr:DUF362 domain-containing protein [Bryobacteraceae bacterium]